MRLLSNIFDGHFVREGTQKEPEHYANIVAGVLKVTRQLPAQTKFTGRGIYFVAVPPEDVTYSCKWSLSDILNEKDSWKKIK